MGWETTPITIGLFMDTIKLERNGKVIVRSKADYEMNKSAYDFRGFKEYVEKPKPQPKPEPKPETKVEKPKEELKVEVKKDSEWEKEEAPKKTETKKAE